MHCCQTTTDSAQPAGIPRTTGVVSEKIQPPTKSIMVVGAIGNVGSLILRALLEHNKSRDEDVFTIVLLTRSTSFNKVLGRYSQSLGSAAFLHAAHVQIAAVRTYSDVTTIVNVLKQYKVEIFICAIAAFSVDDQRYLIDACVAAPTVRRFFPSEYSIDTSSRHLVAQHLPPSLLKVEVIDCLRQAVVQTHGRLSWTAVITGSILDQVLSAPDVAGIDLKNMTATIFDGGNTSFEATTSTQLGRTIIPILLDEDLLRQTQNQYVFVKSFTITQNQILELVEELTRRPFERHMKNAKDSFSEGKSIMDSKGGLDAYRAFQPHGDRPYPKGVPEMILAATCGGGSFASLNRYIDRHQVLWNERLNLPVEDVTEAVRAIVERMGLLKEETETLE